LGGQWNWTGKLFALTAALIIYLLIKRKFLNQYDFFKLSQAKHSLKPNLILILLLVVITVIYTRFFGDHSEFTIETLLFQLLPGIEEEIVFRGLMLGLLLSIMKDKVVIGNMNIGYPSIYTTSILFGLAHGLSFNELWQIDFNLGYCFITFLYGTVWGWMTLKSGSILLPIIAHNLLNISITLVAILNTTANSGS
jgi:membrane protease YdiL (CAAX protease family)